MWHHRPQISGRQWAWCFHWNRVHLEEPCLSCLILLMPRSRHSHLLYGTRSSSPNTSHPILMLKTQGTMTTRLSGPSSTLTSLNPAILRGNSNNNGPGGCNSHSALEAGFEWRAELLCPLSVLQVGKFLVILFLELQWNQCYFSINDLAQRACTIPKVKSCSSHPSPRAHRRCDHFPVLQLLHNCHTASEEGRRGKTVCNA